MATLHQLAATTPGLPCRTDMSLWFSTDPIERHDAAQQCRHCPLLLACMQDALARDEQHGVWGGIDMEARAVGCGSERGYRRHVRRRETPCPGCRAAHDAAVEADRRRRLAVEHAAGGTVRGYAMHRRLGEEACRSCKRAQARKSAEARRARAGGGAPVTPLDGRRATEPTRGAQAAVQPASRAA